MIHWLFAMTTLALIWNGLRLRARAHALETIAPPGPSDPPVASDTHEWIAAESVRIDADTERAVRAFAAREDLEVVELIPADLPIERALDVLRYLEPRSFRRDRVARSLGPAEALLATRDVLRRAGVVERSKLDPAAFFRAANELKRCAAVSSDFAVAPALRASSGYESKRYAWLREAFAREIRLDAAGFIVGVELLECAWLMTALASGTGWGVAAVAAYHLQPYLVFSGVALRPRDLGWRPWLRLPLRIADLVKTLLHARSGPSEPDPVEKLRPEYVRWMAPGTDRFLEPRRSDCPLCGSVELSVRVITPDFLQCKPGRFTLEECGACGHVFQNPRLTLEGLDFYYKDFWEGLCGGFNGLALQQGESTYRVRAEMLRGVAEPKRWLDVGAGHGHFGLFAREVWPDASFDGLDLSESIELAERRRWIDTGYRGLFPELAAELCGRYDVVSMHHYLEHTRDPSAEVAAAAQVLCTGGHLLIEVPDPEYPLGRVLGSYWAPWAQPQHQHLLSLANLTRLLREHGFEPVQVHTGSAHMPNDAIFWVYFTLQRWAPPVNVPWRPVAGASARLRRRLAVAVFAPLFVLAAIVDGLSAVLLRRASRSNTYRVLARRVDERSTGLETPRAI